MYTTLIEPAELAARSAAIPSCCDRSIAASISRAPTGASRPTPTAIFPARCYAHLDRDLSGPITAHQRPPSAAGQRDVRGDARALGHRSRHAQVVAYDQGNGAYAARLWWLLRWLGHRAASPCSTAASPRGSAAGLPVRARLARAAARRFDPHRADASDDHRRSSCSRRSRVGAVAAGRRARRRALRGPQRNHRSGRRPRPGRPQSSLRDNLGATAASCPPASCGAAGTTLLGAPPLERRRRDVRLGRDRLPQLLALELAGLPGRAPVRRLVERVDPRPVAEPSRDAFMNLPM